MSLTRSTNIRQANLEEPMGQSMSVDTIVKSIYGSSRHRRYRSNAKCHFASVWLESACHLAFPDSGQTSNPTLQHFKHQLVTFFAFRIEVGSRILFAARIADIIREKHYTGRKLAVGIASSAKNPKALFRLSFPLTTARATRTDSG